MKLKTTLLALLATAGLVLSASGQVTIYSADFSATSTIIAHDTGPTGTLATGPGSASGPNFTISWTDGDLIASDGSGNQWETDGSVLRGEDWGGPSMIEFGSINLAGYDSVDIAVVGTMDVNTGSEFGNWSYQLDSDTPISTSTNTGDTGANFDYSWTSTSISVTGKSSLSIFLDFTFNGSSDFIEVSSVTVTGYATPIPEPGTYAAFAGILALGMILHRRRKQAASAEA